MGTGSKSERLRAKWRRWLLLDANRGVVAGMTAFVLFAFLASVSLSGLAPLLQQQSLYYVYGGLLSGNLTDITVVVSISQLLLSRQLNTPSELRSQMEGVIDYRKDVEDAAGRVAPVEPWGSSASSSRTRGRRRRNSADSPTTRCTRR